MSEIHTIEPAKEGKPHPKGLRILATIASYVFHPVFMPTVMTIVLYRLAPTTFAGISSKNLKLITMQFFISTAFFPIIITLLTKAVGFIDSVHLRTSKDRIIPLIGTMMCYFWINMVVGNKQYPELLHVLSLGSFWGVIAIFMINIFVKISMHTAAAGSMLGILLVLMFTSPINLALPFFIALVIAGIIGTARMILGAHYPAEIWLGYIVGILVMLGAYWYL
ncbi:MAG TPA: phosphatase PAP2 family protein [Flavipsychrobacter sp.]|nr:phosphatase PAP2 family protein [Flavipsychrobacter sp.]